MTMQTQANLADIKEKTADNALQQTQLHAVAELVSALKRIIVRYHDILEEEGVCKEMQQLEEWLETERKGPVPAGVISESGIGWLSALRDRLKLAGDENLRLEGEGGNPASKEQIEKTEELLKSIRRIDTLIDENTIKKPH